MTRSEAGRLGGLKTFAKLGVEHYREMGRKGGLAVLEKFGPSYLKELASKGGHAWAERYFNDYDGLIVGEKQNANQR